MDSIWISDFEVGPGNRRLPGPMLQLLRIARYYGLGITEGRWFDIRHSGKVVPEQTTTWGALNFCRM